MNSLLALAGIVIVGIALWRIAVAIRRRREESDDTEGGVGGKSDRKPAKH